MTEQARTVMKAIRQMRAQSGEHREDDRAATTSKRAAFLPDSLEVVWHALTMPCRQPAGPTLRQVHLLQLYLAKWPGCVLVQRPSMTR